MTVTILLRESNGFFLFSGKIKPKNKSLKLVITEPFILYLALHSYLLLPHLPLPRDCTEAQLFVFPEMLFILVVNANCCP